MKNCKRLCSMAMILLLCFLLVCPAYAVDSSEFPDIAEVDIYPVDTDGYSGNLWALNGEGREIQLSGNVLVGSSAWSAVSLSEDVSSFSWAGNGLYNWQNYNLGSNSSTVFYSISNGSFVDIYSTEIFPAVDGGDITLSGSVQFYLIPTQVYLANDGSPVGDLSSYAVYPVSCAVIADGLEQTDLLTGVNGRFSVECSVSNSDPVTHLGFRFYFSEVSSSYNIASSSSRSVLFALYDDTLTEVYDPNGTGGLLQTVISEVKALPTTIYNFFFGDDGDDAAEGFKSDVDSAVSSVDQVQQEITEGLQKPEPDTIVPDLDDVISQDDLSSFTNVFASVLQTGSIIADMMLTVCVLAMLSYVFFGKKG